MQKYKVVIPYATDYDQLSLGGIRSYIEAISQDVPEEIELTLLGIEGAKKLSNVHKGSFDGMRVKPYLGRLNLGFLFELTKRNLSRFDLVLCHRAETALLVRLIHRKKVILTLHGGTFNALKGQHKIFGLLYPFIELIASMLAESVQAVNVAIINPIVRKLSKFGPAPLLVRHDLFFPGKEIGNEIFLIGRLEREKRFDLALKLIHRAQVTLGSPIRVNVVGDGSCREKLEKISNSLKLETTFHGARSPTEVAGLLREHGRLLILTSRFEGAPIVVIEALLSGLHVIALKSTGISENISNIGAELAMNEQEFVAKLCTQLSSAPSKNEVSEHIRKSFSSNSSLYWNECINHISRPKSSA
jgi:glycosyltransferase involved in cell wall biosynthesis